MTAGRLTTLAPLLLVGALAALSFWLDRLAHGPERDPSSPSRHDPDYIIDRLSGVRIGESGTPVYTLSAARMVHYPDDDSTLLTAPRFISYGSAKAQVTITASAAVVSSKGDHVYFQDDVRVVRAAHGDMGELVMSTTFLHVAPDHNVAKTDRLVTIFDGATKVTAEGLEMNNQTRVIKLMSKVRGTYDPSTAPRD